MSLTKLKLSSGFCWINPNPLEVDDDVVPLPFTLVALSFGDDVCVELVCMAAKGSDMFADVAAAAAAAFDDFCVVTTNAYGDALCGATIPRDG